MVAERKQSATSMPCVCCDSHTYRGLLFITIRLNMTVTTNLILSKKSSESEINLYFNAILKLAKASEKYPVNLDEVWMLVYTRRDSAIDALKRDFIENDDYLPIRNSPNRSEMGRFSGGGIDYFLTVSCLEYFIARKVRPVFEVYRQVFHKATTFRLPDFSNPAEAARAWAQQYEERKELEYKNAQLEQEHHENQPKVEFANSVMQSTDCIGIGEMAQILKQNKLSRMGQNRFYEWLRYNGFLLQRGSRRNLPAQKSINLGIMKIAESVCDSRMGVIINRKAVITPQGQAYFVDYFRKLSNNGYKLFL